MKVNKKAAGVDRFSDERLAGGHGALAAKQSVLADLKRVVMANLLWERQFYVDGEDVTARIRELVPQVDTADLAGVILASRVEQKLRHVPLLLLVEALKWDYHRGIVRELIPQVCTRLDMLADLLALYWADGRKPIAAQLKKGIRDALPGFGPYALAKYKMADKSVKTRDLFRITHPNPANAEQEKAIGALLKGELGGADTWEVALSAGANKRETWERLISEGKLGALALLRNLRNMQEARVPDHIIRDAILNMKTEWVLPFQFFNAAKYGQKFESALETAMFGCLSNFPKLPGHTIFLVDVSGSMGAAVSARSDTSRMDVACAMAAMAREVCQSVSIYATAGSDPNYTHRTALVKNARGFDLSRAILNQASSLGGGGIFTRQALEYVKNEVGEADRIIVFSDSQDCDHHNRRVPKPFGKYNYIVDVAAERYGINYRGVWTAEVSGWSEHFLTFIAANEGLQIPE